MNANVQPARKLVPLSAKHRTLIRETSYPYPRNIAPLSAKHRTLIRKTSHPLSAKHRTLIRKTSHPYPRNIVPLSAKHRTLIRETSYPYPSRRGAACTSLATVSGNAFGSSPACRALLRRAEGTGCSMEIGANLYEALLRQRQAHCATERRSEARAPPPACASQSSTLRDVRASNATQSIASASFADDCAVASTYHVAAEAVMQRQRRRIMGGQTSSVHICCHLLKCRRRTTRQTSAALWYSEQQ